MSIRHLHKIWVGYGGWFDKINRSPQQVFQPQFQAHIPIERSLPPEILKFHKKVEIAGGLIEISARGGTEQLQPRDMMIATERFDRGTILFDQRNHNIANYTLFAAEV